MVKYSLSVILIVGLFLLSCSSEEPENPNQIIIDGSSTVFPISESIAEEFRKKHPGIEVSVAISGTGGGFQKFIQTDIDILNASREIQESENESAEKNDIEHVQLQIGYDGLAVVVNSENDWVDYLTVDELEEIWEPSSQNSITTWNDIREEWPEEELHLYAPGVASGTYDFFTEVIIGESGSSRGDFTSSEDDNTLVQGVGSDQYALGFFGMAYFKENQEQLKLVGIDEGAGESVKPTVETVSSGDYSPLSRPLFIYITREAAQDENVQMFVDFYLERVPQIIEDVGYVSMPDSAYQQQREKFEAFISEMDTTAVN